MAIAKLYLFLIGLEESLSVFLVDSSEVSGVSVGDLYPTTAYSGLQFADLELDCKGEEEETLICHIIYNIYISSYIFQFPNTVSWVVWEMDSKYYNFFKTRQSSLQLLDSSPISSKKKIKIITKEKGK